MLKMESQATLRTLQTKEHLQKPRTPGVKLEGPYLPLTVQDLVKAEFAILKFVQSSAFSEKNPCFGTIGN